MTLVRTDVSEERISSIIRVTRRVTEARDLLRLLVTANVIPTSPILVTLMMETIRCSETSVLKDPQGVTSHKTTFFIVTAVKTSYLTQQDTGADTPSMFTAAPNHKAVIADRTNTPNVVHSKHISNSEQCQV
jgi:hypothetical protein